MINDKIYVMDVYFAPGDKGATATPAFLNVSKSWDGTFYGETNVKSLAGQDKTVIGEDRSTGSPGTLVATINGTPLNSLATIPHWWKNN